jgi:hypothetical protein
MTEQTGRIVTAEEARVLFKSLYGERFVKYIDFSGDCWLWTGRRSTKTRTREYGHFQMGGRGSAQRGPHRLALMAVLGNIEPKDQVDHRDGCSGLCVRPDHLRVATHAENQRNRYGPQASNKLGVRGVYVTTAGRYATRVQRDGKFHTAGTYSTIEEAREAVAALRRELFGEQWAGAA